MPYEIRLKQVLRQAGWKIKIFDAETGLEEPHVTILNRLSKWRFSLRTGEFLDEGHDWSQISREVRAAIEENWETLKEQWDLMFPGNPISSKTDE